MMMKGGTEAGRRASPIEGSNRVRVPPDLKGANDHPVRRPGLRTGAFRCLAIVFAHPFELS